MGRRDGCADLVRLVRGERGSVELRMELVIRCEYGSIIPWVRRLEDGRHTAVAGPDRLTLSTSVETHGKNLRTIAEFAVHAGILPFDGERPSIIDLIQTTHDGGPVDAAVAG